MVAYTTTYNLKKPTVADDEDVWGGYLNDSMDIIDDVLDGTVPVTGIDINSGTLDNVVIGGTTANTGTFTVLSATTSLGVTGNITVSGTVDGVDVAARDAVLTSTTTTANAALPKAGGTMTGAITFATGQTFDGRDVSADGTKLDGIESGATADQTAAEILTAIKTVDGSSSGLDADTLDGYQGTRFIKTNYDHSSNWNPAGVGNFVGGWHGPSGGGDGYISLGSSTHALNLIVDGNFYAQGNSANKVWHAGNDGSGSGLDADTLDGIQASSFLRSDASDTFTSISGTSVTVSDDLYVGDQIIHSGDTDTYLQFDAANSWRVVTGNVERIQVNSAGIGIGNTSAGGTFGNGKAIALGDNDTGIRQDGDGQLELWANNQEIMHLNTSAVTINKTLSLGANVINDVEDIHLRDKIFHDGDTNTYFGFGGDTISLVTGGSERLALNNSGVFAQSAVHEDYNALSGTTPTCDPNNGGAFSLTMTGNTTFTFGGTTSNYGTGFVLQLTGNGSTVTWPTSVDWAGGTAPDAPASGETDIYVFWTRDGGTTWYGVLSVDAAA